MSYLDGPRFVVRELEGYGRATLGGGSAGHGLTVTVIDRAYCGLVVASQRSEELWTGRGLTRIMILARMRVEADRICAELNAKHG